MDFYALHGETLGVSVEERHSRLDLSALLKDLSFSQLSEAVNKPSLSISVTVTDEPSAPLTGAVEVFHRDGIRGLCNDDVFYLTEGASLFCIQPNDGSGVVTLAPNFYQRTAFMQQQFWGFGLLKLLRARGMYGLHAAGVVTPSGKGMLVVGESGSGKSTLAAGLVRCGWRYASDDAVLLRDLSGRIEALALRNPFYLFKEDRKAAEVNNGEVKGRTDAGINQKHRVDMREMYPEQFASELVPQYLLFSELTGERKTTLSSLDHVDALGRLLTQSGPQIFDDANMRDHMNTLSSLIRQCEIYELWSGLDLYDDPAILLDLLLTQKENGYGQNHHRADESL